MPRKIHGFLSIVAAAGLVLSVPVIAHAALLWDNGPLITNPTGGTSSILGLPISRTETGTNLGRTSRTFRNEAIADDFTVPASGWDLSTATFYVYVSGVSETNPTTTSINRVTVNLWNAGPFSANSPDPRPDPLPTPIFAQNVELPVISATFIGHRTSATSTASIRPMFALTVSLDGLPNAGVLSGGEYWIQWSYGSTTVNDPSASSPIVTPRASAQDLDARQFNYIGFGPLENSWFEPRDGFTSTNPGLSMAFPFQLTGAVIPEPSSVALLIPASMLLMHRRPRR